MRARYIDLLKALRDPDPRRADNAFDAILFDREEALPALQEAYRKARRDTEMRYLLIQLMGFSGSTKAIDSVKLALSDSSPRVRAEACRALEDLGAKDCIPTLQECVRDRNAEVRLAAMEALVTLRQ